MSLGTHDGCYGPCVVCKDGVERIGHTGDTRCPSPGFQTLSAEGSPCRRTLRRGMRDGGLGPCVRCKDGVDRISHTGDIEVFQSCGFSPA